MDLVTKCGIDLKFGIVQTAYANGGSTDYIQNKLVWWTSDETTHMISTFAEFRRVYRLVVSRQIL